MSDPLYIVVTNLINIEHMLPRSTAQKPAHLRYVLMFVVVKLPKVATVAATSCRCRSCAPFSPPRTGQPNVNLRSASKLRLCMCSVAPSIVTVR